MSVKRRYPTVAVPLGNRAAWQGVISPVLSRRITVTVLMVAMVFAITAVTAGRGALTYSALSPVDELVHFDYAYKAYEGNLIPSYPFNSGLTLTQEACRGVLPVFPNPPTPNASTCARGITDAQAASEGSVDYVLMYPPVYYAAVAAGMHILHPFGIGLFTAARLVNVFFYALAAALLALALVRLGVSRRLAFGAVLAVALIPGVEFWGETVTPDSCAMLFGALGLLLVTMNLSPFRRALLGAGVGMLAGLVTDNLAPIGAVVAAGCFLLPDGLVSTGADSRIVWPRGRRLVAAVASVGAALALPLVWSEFRFLVIPVLRHFNEAALSGGTYTLQEAIASAVGAFVQPLNYNYFVPRPVGTMISTILNTVLFGGAAVLAFCRPGIEKNVRILAWGCLVALAVDVLYVVLPFYVRGHVYVGTVRYAVELIPLAVAAVALAVNRGSARWIVFVGGIATACYFVIHIPMQFI